MDTRIKRALIVTGITTALGLPLSGQASDGTITFTGAVTASTCSITVTSNGTTTSTTGADATVALPTVSTAALTTVASSGGTSRTTAAGTFFSINLTGCVAATDILPGPAAPTTVGVYFEAGPNVDTLTGGLINSGGTSNVEVNLYVASKAAVVTTKITPGSSVGQATAITLPTTTTGTQYFYAGYSTAGAGIAATAGSVSTSVTYSLVYL